MQNDLINTLQSYGMSEKEARIYLTTLELGSAPASSIGRKAGIKRVTAYAILKELETKSIASSIEKKGIRYFQVKDPKQLAKRLEKQLESFNQKVPELLALTNLYHNKPRIRYFEGVDGLKEMYDDILDHSDPYFSFLGPHSNNQELSDHLNENFLPQRLEKGITAKVIMCQSEGNKEKYPGPEQSSDKLFMKYTIIKEVEDTPFQINNEINIYGNSRISFALFTDDELSGILIESKRLHDTLSNIHQLIWSQN